VRSGDRVERGEVRRRRERRSCCGEVVAADRSGRALLIHFTDTTHPGGIFRWSPGRRRPAFLGALFVSATWVPGA
jgi:hypothetical protein